MLTGISDWPQSEANADLTFSRAGRAAGGAGYSPHAAQATFVFMLAGGIKAPGEHRAIRSPHARTKSPGFLRDSGLSTPLRELEPHSTRIGIGGTNEIKY
jgi:hypothetical protein